MSIEENLASIAKSLQELVEQGRLGLALKAAQNAEKTSLSMPQPLPQIGPSEPALTESAPPPSPTPTTSVPAPESSPPAEKPKNKGGRPRKSAIPAEAEKPVPLAKLPDVIPPGPVEAVIEPEKPSEPVAIVEQRDPVDDFLDSDPTPAKVYPEPTTENVRKALIEYAERHGGASPGAGGRAAARALMKTVTGCEVMPQLDKLVADTGDTGHYAKVIKAAMDG